MKPGMVGHPYNPITGVGGVWKFEVILSYVVSLDQPGGEKISLYIQNILMCSR